MGGSPIRDGPPSTNPRETHVTKLSPSGAIAEELNALESLRRSGSKTGAHAARQFLRYITRGEAVIYPMSRRTPADAGAPIFLRDVGRGGVGFICQRDLPARGDWRIVFLRDGYAVAESAINLCHTQRVRDGVFLCGGRFVAGAGLLTTLGVAPHALENEYAALLESGPNFGSGDLAKPAEAA